MEILVLYVIPDETVEEIKMTCEIEVQWPSKKKNIMIVLKEYHTELVFKDERIACKPPNYIFGFLKCKPGKVALAAGLTVSMLIKTWEIKYKQT